MGTIAEKLTYLGGTKSAIKDAIEEKGVTVPAGATFRDFVDLIGDIGGGGTKCASGFFRLTVNVSRRFECGFKPKGIMLLMGVIPDVTNANLRGGMYIDENGMWADIHTNTTGVSSYTSKKVSPAMQTTFTIDDTGFTLMNSNANFCSRTWAFIAISETIEDLDAE